MNRLTTISIAFAAIISTAAAQWQQTMGPAGGVARAMAACDGSILAVFHPDALYRLSPGADRWEHIGTLAAESIVAVGGLLLATTDERAMRSTDGGMTWTPAGPGPHTIVRGVDGTRIYATDQAVLYRSDDAGASWSRFGASLDAVAGPSFAPYVVAASGDTVLVGGGDASGLFRSTDGGATWTAVTLSFPDGAGAPVIGRVGTEFYAQVYDEARSLSHGIYRSGDGGATWSALDEGIPPTPRGPAFAFAFFDEGGDVSAATIAGLLTLEDGRWIGSDPGVVVATASDPAGRRYRASFSGVRRSDDGGLAWETINRGVLNQNVGAITTEGSAVLAGGSDGIYRSVDRGASWERVSDDRIVELAHGASWILGRGERGTNTGLVRSGDGGRSWSPANAGIAHPSRGASAIAIAGDVAYAAYHESVSEPTPIEAIAGGLYRSTDAGVTWSIVRDGLPSHGDTTLAVLEVAASGRTALALTFGGLYRSLDDGSSWQPVPNPPFDVLAARLLVAHGEAYYMTRSNAVYRSDDAGLTWTEVGRSGSPLPSFILSLSTLGDALVAICGSDRASDGMFVLANDAWQRFPTPLPDGVAAKSLAMAEGRLYMATASSSVLRLDVAPSGIPAPASLDAPAWERHPLRGVACLALTLERDADVALSLIDMTGVESARTGVRLPAGRRRLELPLDGVAPGVYAYRLSVGDRICTGVAVVAADR
jgi:photosystem II stability/assembly factor-like uncharacterized protein